MKQLVLDDILLKIYGWKKDYYDTLFGPDDTIHRIQTQCFKVLLATGYHFIASVRGYDPTVDFSWSFSQTSFAKSDHNLLTQLSKAKEYYLGFKKTPDLSKFYPPGSRAYTVGYLGDNLIGSESFISQISNLRKTGKIRDNRLRIDLEEGNGNFYEGNHLNDNWSYFGQGYQKIETVIIGLFKDVDGEIDDVSNLLENILQNRTSDFDFTQNLLNTIIRPDFSLDKKSNPTLQSSNEVADQYFKTIYRRSGYKIVADFSSKIGENNIHFLPELIKKFNDNWIEYKIISNYGLEAFTKNIQTCYGDKTCLDKILIFDRFDFDAVCKFMNLTSSCALDRYNNKSVLDSWKQNIKLNLQNEVIEIFNDRMQFFAAENDEGENRSSKETDFMDEAFLEIEKNLTIFGKPRNFRDSGKRTLKITDRNNFKSKSPSFSSYWNSLFKKQKSLIPETQKNNSVVETIQSKKLDQIIENKFSKKIIVIGLGLPNSGLRSISKFINNQLKSSISYNLKEHRNDLDFNDRNPCQIFAWDQASSQQIWNLLYHFLAKNQESADFIGDFSIQWLTYLPYLLKKLISNQIPKINFKIIVIKRDRSDLISSLKNYFEKTRIFPLIDNEFKKITKYENHVTDLCYPTFSNVKIENLSHLDEIIAQFYDGYYQIVEDTVVNSNFDYKIYDSYQVMNNLKTKKDLLTWLGFTSSSWNLTHFHDERAVTNRTRLEQIRLKYRGQDKFQNMFNF